MNPRGWMYAIAGALLAAGAVLLAGALVMEGSNDSASDGDTASAEEAQAQPGADGKASAGERSPFPERFDRLAMSVGPDDAPVVVREFGDYQCPACGRFAEVSKRLRETLVAEGTVRFVYYDFPLSQMHDHSVAAAEAARCAGRQDAYWGMHDRLFEAQDEWSEADDPVAVFRGYAQDMDLDGEQLASCISEDRTRQAVMESRSFGQKIGVSKTPTVIVDNVPMRGVPGWEDLRTTIEDQLEGSSGG